MKINSNSIYRAINNKFIKPLNNGLDKYYNITNGFKNVRHDETISLLRHAYVTINNAERLLKDFSFVDANTLMRSSFEYLLVGMMIEFGDVPDSSDGDNEDECHDIDDVYNEFIVIDSVGKKRVHTDYMHLINHFKKHMNDISFDLFSVLNKTFKGDMLEGLYSDLSLSTHASLYVCAMANISDTASKQTIKSLMNLNLYFIKILLFYCLKYILKDEKYCLDVYFILYSFIFYYACQNDLYKSHPGVLEKYKGYFHMDVNNEYFNNNISKCEKIINKGMSNSDTLTEEATIKMRDFLGLK